MPQWFTVFSTNLGTSLLFAVFTAIITVRLALRRFRAERWWERKADAYSRIVEALHSLMEYSDAMSEEEKMRGTYSEERKKELGERLTSLMDL